MNDILAITDTSEFKKPYYTVQISYAGTGAEFRLNDIPFYLENRNGQVDVEIPVGDKVINGINELSIISFPFGDNEGYKKNWENKDSRAEATLYVREKDASKESRKLITHVKIYPAIDPELASTESIVITEQELPVLDYKSKPRSFPYFKFDNQVVISRKTHEIKTPFPRWEWQDGDVIENNNKNYLSLLEAYRKEYTIHQNQDLKASKKSHYKLAVTQNVINHYDDIDRAYVTLNLEESWKSDEQELFKFIEDDLAERQGMKLDIIANGKMARIINDSNIQPILFIIKSQRMKIQYSYSFYKNKQGEWIYIM
ncbi:MAG: hypothetical protein QM500_17635 [Methylococcales bacterium]